jgi:hypothetical protein
MDDMTREILIAEIKYEINTELECLKGALEDRHPAYSVLNRRLIAHGARDSARHTIRRLRNLQQRLDALSWNEPGHEDD